MTDASTTPPTLIAGRYRVLSDLPRGGQSQGWRVEDLVHPERGALVLKWAPQRSDDTRAILREFSLLTDITGPHIVPVLDLGWTTEPMSDATQTGCYLTRTYIEGAPARLWLTQTSIDPPSRVAAVISIGVAIAEALITLHSMGVVHGDLKSENVLVSGPLDTPNASLIDFGLGGLWRVEGLEASGTPEAMAPELWSAEPSASRDRRAADVYAFGVLLFELLMLRRPFSGESLQEIMRAHLNDPLPPIELDRPRLEGLIRRMLARRPEERPPAAEVLLILSEQLDEPAARAMSLPQTPSTGAQPLGTRLPFLGREPLLERLTAFCSGTDAQAFAIVGALGVGKTRVIEQLRWRLQLKKVPVVEVPCLSTGDVWGGLHRVATQLASLTNHPMTEVPFHHPTTPLFRSSISHWLNTLAPPRGVVVIWTQFDAAGPDLQRWLLEHIERHLNVKSPLRWVLSAQALSWFDAQLHPETRQHIKHHVLGGLDWEEVFPWLHQHHRHHGEGRLRAIERVFHRVGGHPMLFEAALLAPPDTPQSAATSPLDHLRGLVAQLSEESQVVGASLAALGAEVSLTALAEVWRCVTGTPIDARALRAALEQLRRRQLARSLDAAGSCWRLQWPVLGDLLHEALSLSTGRSLLFCAAHWLEKNNPKDLKLHIFTLVLSGFERLAPGDLFTETLRDLHHRWRDIAGALEAAQAYGHIVDLLIRLIQRSPIEASTYPIAAQLCDAAIICGRSERALEVLRPLAASAPTLTLEVAKLLHALGRLEDAAETLDGMREEADGEDTAPRWLTPPERLKWLLLRAQITLRTGPFERASRLAQRGLDDASAQHRETPNDGALSTLRGRLAMQRAAAAVFLGEADALECLDEAQRLLQSASTRGDDLARLYTFRAIALNHTGDLEGSARAYQQALEEAEQAGLQADLPIYLLNLGTAHHRQGRLGLAREYYTQGTQASLPSTRPSTRALLLANRANIDIALGRVGEARGLLERARRHTSSHALPLIEAFIMQLRGDADADEQDYKSAQAIYTLAAERYRAHDDSQHSAELLLKLAEVSFEQHDPSRTQRLLDDARSICSRGHFSSLQAHHDILSGRWMLKGEGAGSLMAIERFRLGLERAAAHTDHLLVLRHAPHLLARLQREGMHELIEQTQQLTLRSWRAIASGLNRALRRDYMTLIEQRGGASIFAALGRGERGEAAIQRAAPVESERFYQLLSLNARIINEPNLSRLLPAAMDIALTLSQAERGFLLLRDPTTDAFRVAISRDVDGEPIQRPHLKVSLTIAREVADSGEQVLTIDAQDDQRFAEAMSVHRLELTSVLCVPIKDRDGVIGTLYLDHRFRPNLFEGEIPRMMRAFADQLALALRGSRRMQALEAERNGHERARRQVEALLAEKEALISELKSRYHALTEEVKHKDKALKRRHQYDNIIASSSNMQQVFDRLDRVVDNLIPVLILGESGTGKELIARALHYNSPRAKNPFVAFNCGAVSETLSESELFGHVRGAFTGADRPRDGLFVAADRGTIFLDELGELSPHVQVKLLRAIQERRIRPVGATEERAVDVRIVAATNRSLEEMVAAGTFREDLYWRLSAFIIDLPPLRERREDIPLLARYFLKRFADEEGLPRRELSTEAITHLYHAHWPGNVRQLENALRTASVLASGPLIEASVVARLVDPSDSQRFSPSRSRSPAATSRSPASKRGRRAKASRQQVVDALRAALDDRPEAARILGVSERTLYRYLNRFGLT